MIVQQHDKTGVSESLSKLREAVLLYGRAIVMAGLRDASRFGR
jgi:hypothetical protein